jgi:hypothetical protein
MLSGRQRNRPRTAPNGRRDRTKIAWRRALKPWHATCLTSFENLLQRTWSITMKTTMKFEAALLHGLFAACMLLCLGVMSAMLVLPTPATLAANQAQATAVASTEG